MRREVVIRVTPAQARAINAALAYCTAGSYEDGGMESPRQVETAVRAQRRLHAAMLAAGVTP